VMSGASGFSPVESGNVTEFAFVRARAAPVSAAKTAATAATRPRSLSARTKDVRPRPRLAAVPDAVNGPLASIVSET
jgi:hypothetical protein